MSPFAFISKLGFFSGIKPGRRFYVFLVSLFLAGTLWLLNALNKTYVEEMEVSIRYINLPENQVFSPIPTTKLKIEISGDGYSILQIRREIETDTVLVDLKTVDFESVGTSKRAKLPAQLLIQNFRNSWGNGVVLKNIGDDSVLIYMVPGKTLEIPVLPNTQFELAKGYTLAKSIFSTPATVQVSGPASILDTLRFIETSNTNFGKLSKTKQVKSSLIYDKRFLIIPTINVQLVAQIESMTEGEIDVPIHVLGAPLTQNIRLIPENIRIKYTAGLSQYGFVKADLFSAVVRYEDLLSKPSKLSVVLESVPSFVTIISYSPERVDYLLLNINDL